MPTTPSDGLGEGQRAGTQPGSAMWAAETVLEPSLIAPAGAHLDWKPSEDSHLGTLRRDVGILCGLLNHFQAPALAEFFFHFP